MLNFQKPHLFNSCKRSTLALLGLSFSLALSACKSWSASSDPSALEMAYSGNFKQKIGKDLVCFEKCSIGNLSITTNKLVACDALVESEFIQFNTAIPVGKFPVELAIAKFPNGDERVALARIRFSPEPTTSWQMALLPNQDIKKLKKGEIFGYGVDSGTGSFMDTNAAKALQQKAKDNPDFTDDLIKSMEPNYKHTRDWCIFKFENHSIAMFSSGFGDGLYATYFGYSKNMTLTTITTDFGVIEWQ